MAESPRKPLLSVLVVLVLAAPTGSAYTLWGTDWGAGATVSYSFDTAGGYTIDETGIGWGLYSSTAMGTVFDAGWENEIIAAFDTWAAVADISFTQVADNGVDFNAGGAEGDIRVACHTFDGVYNVLAHAYYPPPNGNTAAGDCHFDEDEPWYVGPGVPGGGEIDLFSVALHELGHSIGLGHSADSDAVMFATYAYNAGRTLDADDIAGAQAVYGEDSSGTPEPATYLVIFLFLAAAVFLRGNVAGAAAEGHEPHGTCRK